MEVILDRDRFVAALARLKGVVDGKAAAPILSHILLDAGGDSIALTATDTDRWITVSLPGHVGVKRSKFCLPGIIVAIVGKLPSGSQVQLVWDDKKNPGRAMVISGASRFALPVLPALDFPEQPRRGGGSTLMMPAHSLSRAFSIPAVAQSTEETRYYLNGIYLHASADSSRRLAAVATDGHRLVKVEIPLSDEDSWPHAVIIPRAAVPVLAGLLADSTADIEVEISPVHFRISFGEDDESVAFSTKLVEGSYPDYWRLIPTENSKIFQVNKELLRGALSRVVLVASEKSKAVCFEISGSGLELRAGGPDTGSGEEHVEISGYDAAPVRFGANQKLLDQLLGCLPGSTVRFAVSELGGPMLLTCPDHGDVLTLLMPMRI